MCASDSLDVSYSLCGQRQVSNALNTVMITLHMWIDRIPLRVFLEHIMNAINSFLDEEGSGEPHLNMDETRDLWLDKSAESHADVHARSRQILGIYLLLLLAAARTGRLNEPDEGDDATLCSPRRRLRAFRAEWLRTT